MAPPILHPISRPTSRPLIGVTLDHAPGGPPPVFSRFDHYALRAHYFDAVTRAGGIPVGLGHDHAWAAGTIARLDGLLVTGGAFDIAPEHYGNEAAHATTAPMERRTRAERALMEAALDRGLPVLGVCGGMQLLAVVLGGTLIQHIPDAIPDALAHEQPNPRDEAGHRVDVVPGTRLAAIAGPGPLRVNSSHHQAVRTAGSAIVSARAPDGVIEAIEDMGARFILGVQWHPEFAIDPADAALFAAFVHASGDGS